MAKVSVIIPGRNDMMLARTVDEAFKKAAGQVEVVAVVDGPTEYGVPAPHKRLTILATDTPLGVRWATNLGVEHSSGEFVMRLDAHCALSEGYDEILSAACGEEDVVSPRYYDLNPQTFDRQGGFMDYFYLCCPWTAETRYRMTCGFWFTRTMQRHTGYPVDEIMSSHGSCMLMRRSWWDRIGGMDTTSGISWFDQYNVCLKTWAVGGRVLVCKDAWYAHRAPNRPKGYSFEHGYVTDQCVKESTIWIDNLHPGSVRSFEWLIDHFWPLPTQGAHHYFESGLWPENWKDYLNRDNA